MSKDTRSRYEKLESMAGDKSSPNEARLAAERLVREDLAARGIPIPDDLFENRYGDVVLTKLRDLGWVPLYTSNHYAEDEPGKVYVGFDEMEFHYPRPAPVVERLVQDRSSAERPEGVPHAGEDAKGG